MDEESEYCVSFLPPTPSSRPFLPASIADRRPTLRRQRQPVQGDCTLHSLHNDLANLPACWEQQGESAEAVSSRLEWVRLPARAPVITSRQMAQKTTMSAITNERLRIFSGAAPLSNSCRRIAPLDSIDTEAQS